MRNTNNICKIKGPTQIVLNITNKCNLRCLYCFNSSGISAYDELSDSEILKIIFEIIKIHPFNVCFSGGEPLLRRDILYECIRLLHSNNIRTNMVSNGTLLNEQTVKKLCDLGLQEIEVSLDGAEAQTHEILRGKDSFPPVIKALEILRALSFPQYEVSITLTSFNLKSLQQMITLLKEIDVSTLIVRPLIVCGRAIKYKGQLNPTPLQYRRIMYEINEQQIRSNSIKIIYADPLSFLFDMPNVEPFLGMEIRSNGDLVISPYLPIAFGNIRYHTITEYWDNGWWRIGKLPIVRQIINKVKGYSFEDADALTANLEKIDLIDDANRF